MMASCRACLSTDKEMMPFDDMFVLNYNLLTNLEVKLYDKLSHYVCSDCQQKVNYFIEFRTKCITSETVMSKAALKVTKDELQLDISVPIENCDENDVIKQEYKMEFEINDYENRQENNSFEENVILNNICTLLPAESFSCEDIQTELKPNIRRSKRRKTVKCGDTEESMKMSPGIQTEQETKNSKSKKRKTVKCGVTVVSLKMSCGICEKLYQDQKELIPHLENHKNDKICEICQEVFNEWPELLGHRLKHIPEKQRRCHICSKYYMSHISMEYHYRKFHYNGDKVKIKCKQCHLSYDTPKQLKKHAWSVHSLKKLICDYCSKSFNNKQRLKVHIVGHTEFKAYVCDICDFSCKYSSGLKDHKLRKHTPKRVYCKNCRRLFPSQIKMDKHICKVISKLCPICGKEVNGSTRLSRHMETHRGEKRYKCDRCPSMYTSKAALDAHNNRHDGNPTKQCEYCSAKFYSASVLIKHRRIHTGERPYVCKICQRSFTGNSNLKVHMKVHGEHLINKRIKSEDVSNN